MGYIYSFFNDGDKKNTVLSLSLLLSYLFPFSTLVRFSLLLPFHGALATHTLYTLYIHFLCPLILSVVCFLLSLMVIIADRRYIEIYMRFI